MNVHHRVIITGCAFVLACGGTQSADSRIRNVNLVGTKVADTVYADSTFEVIVVPLDAHGAAVLEQGITARASIVSPAGVSASVLQTQCVRNRQRQPLAAGIVVDASSSMASNDPDDASGPAPGRKAAVKKLIGAMEPGDVALLSDFYGSSTTPLRDLVCVASSTESPPPACVATAASLTGDTATLGSATQAIQNHSGTPLYEACLQMVGILGPQVDHRKAMVVLSDGLPEEHGREDCLTAARAANVSIFTVGFGADPGGVQPLRELAEATGGAYAPASDAGQLGHITSDLAFSDGFCTVTLSISGLGEVAPGAPVDGVITVGTNAASANFEFLAPLRP